MAAVSGYCSRWRWVARGGGVAVAVFLFLLSFSLLLLPLAFRLFYCSSSFFPFSPLVLGKEKPMVMLSFVCWFLASLTFSSSLFLLPIPCSAASGSCGWCCRKVKLMVMFFFLFFSAGWTFLRRVLLAWSGSYVIFQTLFPHVAPVPPFVVRSSSVFVFSFPFYLLSLSSLPLGFFCSSCSPPSSSFIFLFLPPSSLCFPFLSLLPPLSLVPLVFSFLYLSLSCCSFLLLL